MPPLQRLFQRAAVRWAGRIVLASIWLQFAITHVAYWARTGDPRGIATIAVETTIAVLFLIRRAPIATSSEVTAWVATVVGTFAPLMLRPGGVTMPGAEVLAPTLQVLGGAFATAGLLAIGRSFGLVAANRGIRTNGPYAVVRHPIYAGYFMIYIGYLLENPSRWNALVVVVGVVMALARIRAEEQILASDAAYVAYRARVRFRLVPYVY